MPQLLIFIPFVGMLLLTLLVFIYMFYLRIGVIRSTGIEPRTRADLEKYPPRAVSSSNNFQNLFELPVIFYACVLALHALNQVDYLHIFCAFGFLIFRILHSVIHCTYNHIMQRFVVYAIASLFLWIMVIRLAFSILRNVAA
ncbi:MAG TPA: MAPEG family protein [Spongiibacteraceae bacterium]|nr:MAPEG family protein [Spongiibacteraceae bacterium]